MPPAPTDADIEAARALFRDYLDNHANSSIERINRPEGVLLGITKPWGEDGIVVSLPQNMTALAEAMNNLILPVPFTAIWHRDSRRLEVIWTAFPVPAPFQEVTNRTFKLQFESVEYECGFGTSSDRLLAIAENALFIGVSETQHRNLQSFNQYLKWKKVTQGRQGATPPPGGPISFWISSLPWDEDRVIRLVRHMNFYMTYYDTISPFVFVWPSKAEAATPRTRYIRGEFPERIDAIPVEDDLLNFWQACRDGDAGRKFVYFYRIIEHASYAYVEREIRLKTRRLVGAAQEFGDTKKLSEKIIATVLGSKMEDAPRIAALLIDTVDPILLWNEILRNRNTFQQTIVFDGGFEVERLITPDDTEVTFGNGGLSRFANLTRQIRNHLSHGRDRSTQTSITPTAGNFRKLEPWVSALSIAAGEVINHKKDL